MLLLLALTMLLPACAMQRREPLTMDQFGFACENYRNPFTAGIMDDDPCQQISRESICQTFREAMAMEFGSQNQCLEQCNTARRMLLSRHLSDGCFPVLNNAYGLCWQYCSDHYRY
jgi:hypothetical protein